MGDHVKVDQALLEQAARLTGEQDPEKVVAEALRELIKRKNKLRALMDIAGKVEFYEGYDHKELRKTRHDAP